MSLGTEGHDCYVIGASLGECDEKVLKWIVVMVVQLCEYTRNMNWYN